MKDLATISGAAAMPRAAVTTRPRESSVATASIMLRVSSAELRFLNCDRTGTNAWENAPSANMRRSRLGILKATKNASVARLAPKMRANRKSRTYPITRLTMVRLLTANRARSRFMLYVRIRALLRT